MFKYLFLLMFMFSNTVYSKTSVVLKQSNTLFLNDYVTTESVNKIVQKALVLDKIVTKEPIYLVLYTGGGSIVDGLDLINAMKSLKRPVHTIVIHAYSMGFIVTQSLGKRYVITGGDLMAHPASGGFYGEFPGQLNNRISFWTKKMHDINTAVAKRSGKTLKQVTTMFDNEYWCNAEDCIKDGFADEVINVSCDSSLSGVYIDKEEFIISISTRGLTKLIISSKQSKCPLSPRPSSVQITLEGVRDDSKESGQSDTDYQDKVQKYQSYMENKNTPTPKTWLNGNPYK